MSSKPVSYSRREFAKRSAMAFSAIPFLSLANPLVSAPFVPSENSLNVHLFSKHLQFLDYNNMSEASAAMGFDGLDLTVRRKGHVLPENVKDDLPKAVAAMKKHGLAAKMMSTNVWDVDDSVQKTVLETASSLGFTHYRTEWLKYPANVSIKESQEIYGKQARALEILNEKLGLIAGYQNHSGLHVGAAVWDLLPILEATHGTHIGMQYDIRHAVLEGGQSWELGLRSIKPYINAIVIKDVKWGQVQGKWQPVNVPLGEGMVNFNRYFSLLKKYKINVPISLHVEHDLGGAEKGATKINIPQKEVFKRIAKDLVYLQEAWKNAE
ncbi:sugar phosphate isomerase/epimerase family protein [Polaribacter sp.]|uniref:sugar phosphate isomerase/epimerase family protein n=1 Tax=Polaribacter sp. TaxID=1920175 RepID=UPI003EF1034C